jgi:ADP-heptose:LPS heptosyltransferase
VTAASVQTILVYTDGEVIGDGVIKLPFIAALKTAFPQARLTWLCGGKTAYTGALQELAMPLIDEIIYAPPPIGTRIYDLVIDTQTTLKRTLWLRRQIQHRKFISSAVRYFLSDARPSFFASSPSRVIDRLFLLASLAAGHSVTPAPLTLPDAKWAALARAILPEGRRYIGFVAGASLPQKCWPLDNFIALAKLQAEQGFVPVFILGPAEQGMQETIRAALPTAVFPLPADASPCLTIAIAQCLTAVVANDSGGGHLMAAGGAPMVSLFRSSSVRNKFTPTTAQVIAFAPEDFKVHTMAQIPFADVALALQRILNSVSVR